MKANKISKFLIYIALMIPGFALAQPDMVFVEGGKFKMGNNFSGSKYKGEADELPVHKVKVNSFYICSHEVTVKEYKQYCKETGNNMPMEPDSKWLDSHTETQKYYPAEKGKTWWGWVNNFPIHNVFWKDAVKYCNWLSKKENLQVCYEKDDDGDWQYNKDRNGYRLPTEAEWEYAARGGKNNDNFRFSGGNNPTEVAWYDDTSSLKGPSAVKTKKPNSLGIYDMSGNVWEWCNDYYNPTFYKNSPSNNPICKKIMPYRVVRGGGWHYRAQLATVTSRDGPKPGFANFNYGFRVAKSK